MSTHRLSQSVLRWVTLLWLTLITVDLAQGESLARKALIGALRSGGYVILMRHASSPRNPPESAQADIVALHVKPDKMPELKRETFTA